MSPYRKKGWSRRFFIFLACSLLLTTFPGRADASRHPAVVMLGLYGLKTDRPVYVNPYIVSILALHSLHEGKHRAEVKDFIQWYLSRLNEPDQLGLTGTIYDYSVGEGWEAPTGKYDSADGYAGVFLTLLRAYAERATDYPLLEKYRTRIRNIASVISRLVDRDGLAAPLPKGKVKYLMNNCEAYGGICGFNRILGLTGEKDGASSTLEMTMKKGILRQFYDAKGENFFWALSGEEKWESTWEKSYPDAFAQIFPIFYSLLEDQS